jgi:hypothetical protein
MALVIQAYTFIYQYANSWLHSTSKKQPDALKMGVISTAQINPAAGMLATNGITMLTLSTSNSSS